MAVVFTDERTIALVDSVTGLAFGPTFDSTDHASDFLKWLAYTGQEDARAITPANLQALYVAWRPQRCDADGYLKPWPEPIEA
jgi:hypothetical protein